MLLTITSWKKELFSPMLAGTTSIDQGRTLSDVSYKNMAMYSDCTVVAIQRLD